MVIVLRYIDDDWKLQKRLAQVKILAKSMTGEEIARELIDTLSVGYGISLLAAMRDRASVNNVALRILKIVYPNLVDIGCIAHTINLAGERFQVPTLQEFINLTTNIQTNVTQTKTQTNVTQYSISIYLNN